jgi:hypothetical protein
MLVIDGHESHIGQQLLRKAHEEKIVICKLPSHTTHVYGVLQRAWQKRCSEIVGESGHTMGRKQVVEQYFIAQKNAFKPETILKSFRTSRLCLAEERVPFKDDDFAPSANTSIDVHIPLGFPADDPTKEDLKLLIGKGLLEDMFVSDNDVAAHYPTDGKGDSNSNCNGCKPPPAVDSDIEMIEQWNIEPDSFLNFKARTPERHNEAGATHYKGAENVGASER